MERDPAGKTRVQSPGPGTQPQGTNLQPVVSGSQAGDDVFDLEYEAPTHLHRDQPPVPLGRLKMQSLSPIASKEENLAGHHAVQTAVFGLLQAWLPSESDETILTFLADTPFFADTCELPAMRPAESEAQAYRQYLALDFTERLMAIECYFMATGELTRTLRSSAYRPDQPITTQAATGRMVPVAETAPLAPMAECEAPMPVPEQGRDWALFLDKNIGADGQRYLDRLAERMQHAFDRGVLRFCVSGTVGPTDFDEFRGLCASWLAEIEKSREGIFDLDGGCTVESRVFYGAQRSAARRVREAVFTRTLKDPSRSGDLLRNLVPDLFDLVEGLRASRSCSVKPKAKLRSIYETAAVLADIGSRLRPEQGCRPPVAPWSHWRGLLQDEMLLALGAAKTDRADLCRDLLKKCPSGGSPSLKAKANRAILVNVLAIAESGANACVEPLTPGTVTAADVYRAAGVPRPDGSREWLVPESLLRQGEAWGNDFPAEMRATLCVVAARLDASTTDFDWMVALVDAQPGLRVVGAKLAELELLRDFGADLGASAEAQSPLGGAKGKDKSRRPKNVSTAGPAEASPKRLPEVTATLRTPSAPEGDAVEDPSAEAWQTIPTRLPLPDVAHPRGESTKAWRLWCYHFFRHAPDGMNLEAWTARQVHGRARLLAHPEMVQVLRYTTVRASGVPGVVVRAPDLGIRYAVLDRDPTIAHADPQLVTLAFDEDPSRPDAAERMRGAKVRRDLLPS